VARFAVQPTAGEAIGVRAGRAPSRAWGSTSSASRSNNFEAPTVRKRWSPQQLAGWLRGLPGRPAGAAIDAGVPTEARDGTPAAGGEFCRSQVG